MNWLSSAFPGRSPFNSEMLFAYFVGGAMLGITNVAQEPDQQACFCWKLGTRFGKTWFCRDPGTWRAGTFARVL